MKKIRILIPGILSCMLLLCGCGKKPEAVIPVITEIPTQQGYIAEGKELFAVTDSREDAEKIAELYGIELAEYSSGVASFHTEEAPGAVIQQGEENNWPRLEINYIRELN